MMAVQGRDAGERQSGRWLRWLGCVAMPAALVAVLYLHAQARVHWPTTLQAQALPSSLPGIRWALEPPWRDAGGYLIQGLALDERQVDRWLRPTILLVASDGHATEYRTNLSDRNDLVAATPAERQQRIASFERHIAERELPSQRPLRFILRLQTGQGTALIDTQASIGPEMP